MMISGIKDRGQELGMFLVFLAHVALGVDNGHRAQPTSIRIAGLFEPEYRGQELVFKYAVAAVNKRRDVLPYTRLEYDVQSAPVQDSFGASKKVCHQLRDGISVMFGPMSSLSAAHVQSICDSFNIPHVETRWNYDDGSRDSFSINLHPHYITLAQAYVDFIEYLKWKSFTILYEDNDSLVRLQEVLKSSAMYGFHITIRKLLFTYDINGKPDYRPVLKEIKNRGEAKIILDCDYKTAQMVLHQALTIEMVTQYYHYLLTSLDISLLDLEDYRHDGCNITAFRLVDPMRPEVLTVLNDWRVTEVLVGESPLENARGARTETALMYDAVHLFAKALHQVSRAQVIVPTSLTCNKQKSWTDGESLLNYMKMTEIDGLTGRVKFDVKGRRSQFKLDLVELTKEGLHKLGVWNPVDGLNITKNQTTTVKEYAENLQNKSLVVTTILEDPYMMIRQDPDGTLVGNDRFEGYCVDLLAEIARLLQFNYTIKLVDDGNYGAPVGENGEWNGMVRELMDRKADLAVASLTISYVREQVIDFTKPFMNLGISILFKRPEKQNPSLFSFLSPLSYEIWGYLIAAYLTVSFMLFVIARFSPYEWYNPHPCNPDSDEVENQFTLLNSFWFTIGSLMQQGSEVAPRAISTRVVSGIWWFFTLIIISSYTANLAAFLTVERMTSPIENADDLSKQTEIKYGTIWGGSTMTFFKNSKIATYERMWNFMSTSREFFPNSTKLGIEWVKQGKYAFLLESTMNEYITERNCELMKVGGLLDSKGYGIGTPQESPFRDLISNAILKLQEDQIMQMLYNKWWKQKGGGGQCDVDDKNKKDANALGIANVGGVFVVLVIGLSLSLIVAVLEFTWKARKNSEEDRLPICTEMGRELRFAMRCFGPDTKPVKKPREVPEDQFDGNGMTMMPLTAGYMPHNHLTVPGEKYA